MNVPTRFRCITASLMSGSLLLGGTPALAALGHNQAIRAPVIHSNQTLQRETGYYGSRLKDPASIAFYNVLASMDFQNIENVEVSDLVLLQEALAYTQGNDLLLRHFGAAIDSFRYDHTDLFYVNWDLLSLSVYRKNGNLILEVGSGRTDTWLIEPDQSAAAMETDYEKALMQLVSGISGTNQEKAKMLNDRICDLVTYSFGSSSKTEPWISTAYGALIYQEAICEGYSRLFKAGLDRLNVPCQLVCGYYLNDGVLEPHMWNYVQDEQGIWYGVDVTMNDGYRQSVTNPGLTTRDVYFWQSADTFLITHIEDGVVSSAAYQMPYPSLSYAKPNEAEQGLLKVEVDSLWGTLLPAFTYDGLSASQLLEERGLYMAFRTRSTNTGESLWSPWQSAYEMNKLMGGIVTDENGKSFFVNAGQINPSVGSVEAAVFDIADDEKYGTLGNQYVYSQNAIASHMLESLVWENIYHDDTYITPAYVKSTIPEDLFTRQQDITQPSHISITYDEPLIFTNGDTPEISWSVSSVNGSELDEAVVRKYARIEPGSISFDGQSTISFTFHPSQQFNHNGIIYTFSLDNMANMLASGNPGVKPNTFGLVYTYQDTQMCSKCFNDGRLKINVYAQPVLADNSDLSLEGWTFEDGSKISQNQRSQLALVVTKPAPAEEIILEEAAAQLASSEGTVLASSTYEISLNVCGRYPIIPNGSYMKINLGFPDGVDASMEGVTFKLYHFRRLGDGLDSLDYEHPEEIECILTENGLVALVSDFSPYVLVAIADGNVSRSLDVNFSGRGGSLISSNGRLVNVFNPDTAIDYELIADEGYEIDYLMLDGNRLAHTDGKFSISYDMLQKSSTLSAGFAAISVVEKEKEQSKVNLQTSFMVKSEAPAAHVHDFEPAFDEHSHWMECICHEVQEEEEHQLEWNEITPANKDQPGLEEGICKCGYTLQRELLFHEHEFGETYKFDESHHWRICDCEAESEKAEHELVYEELIAASEEAPGLKKGTCLCGYTIEEEISVLEHIHDPMEFFDETGHISKCQSCQEILMEEPHQLEQTFVLQPTIFEEGYELFRCACGYEEKGILEKLECLHADYEYVFDEEVHEKLCSICQIRFEAEDHVLKEKVIKEASEEQEGILELSCYCGYRKEETIEKLVHVHDLKPGFDETSHYSLCTKCSEKLDVTDHILESQIIKAATEEEAGEMLWHCSCGYEFTELIEKPEHVHDFIAGYDELSHFLQCRKCGVKEDAADHSFTDKVITEPTEESEGEMLHVCSCGYQYVEPIEKLEHVHVYTARFDETGHWKECLKDQTRIEQEEHILFWSVEIMPTEQAEGLELGQCSCGYETSRPIPKLQHIHQWHKSWNEQEHFEICGCGQIQNSYPHQLNWQILQEPDEHHGGLEEGSCACGYMETRHIDPIPHVHDYVIRYDEKSHWKECSCKDILEGSAHVFVWTEQKAASDAEEGLKEGLCECGYRVEQVIAKLEPAHEHEWSLHFDHQSHWKECACHEKQLAEDHQLVWQTIKEPTELEQGLSKGICSCGYFEEKVLERLEHVHIWISHKDEHGHWNQCSCNMKVDVSAHAFVWTTLTAPNEMQEGLRQGICQCGYIVEEVLEKLPHEHYWMDAQDDLAHYQQCRCGLIQNRKEHDFVYSMILLPTQSETGLEEAICQECGYCIEIILEPVSHVHDYQIAYDEQNHWLQCSCEDIIGGSPHSFAWHVIRDASQSESGLEEGLCECGYQSTREIPKLPALHTHEWITQFNEHEHWQQCDCQEIRNRQEHQLSRTTLKEPTETEEGLREGICSCGYQTTEILEKSEHIHDFHLKFDETWHWMECDCTEIKDQKEHQLQWTILQEAKPGEDGLEQGICQCGYESERIIPALPPEPEHVHDWQISFDKNHHWKTCSCEEIAEKEAHALNWSIQRASSLIFSGKEKGVCSCGYQTERKTASRLSGWLTSWISGISRTEPKEPDPVIPDQPDHPELPEVPQEPEKPVVKPDPVLPDTPQTPENPDNPDITEEPSEPAVPDEPEKPGGSGWQRPDSSGNLWKGVASLFGSLLSIIFHF